MNPSFFSRYVSKTKQIFILKKNKMIQDEVTSAMCNIKGLLITGLVKIFKKLLATKTVVTIFGVPVGT